MKISINWLQDYIKLPNKITPKKLGEDLTMKVVEVEEVIDQKEQFAHMVVGKVVSALPHENADKLKVCQVDVGKGDTIQIVCGGSNVKEGMLVALAKVGARVRWHGEGELIELKEVAIRGEKSFGMICAADEIGLGDMFPAKDKNEIVDLSELSLKVGAPLAEALGFTDTVIDIDNKSMTHRPDLWGHYGIAREVAAMYGQTFSPYNPPEIIPGKEIKIVSKIKQKKWCSRAMFVALDGIKIVPSPVHIQSRLLAAGLKPINIIVDITNYIMLDLGQPMHAHDLNKLAKDGKEITMIVKSADDGEVMNSFDGKEFELTHNMLVIDDEEKPVALAGVIGSDASDIEESTSAIVLEAALFDATNVRKTAQNLGIRTDASTRYEKSLDPYQTELALKRAVQMILEFVPGAKVISNVADSFNEPKKTTPITISLEFLHQKIGVPVGKPFVVDTLKRLGFGVKEKAGIFTINVPTWRATKDVSIAEDIIEEIARMYGYNEIPVSLPEFSIEPPPENLLRDTIEKTKNILAYEANYTEVYNYSFVSRELLEKIGADPSVDLELDNPIAKDRPLIRHNLIPNMLANIESNLHRFDRVAIFEVGKVYRKEEIGPLSGVKDKRLPRQDTLVAISFAQKGEEIPFFEASDVVNLLAKRLGIDFKIEKIPGDHTMVHPGRYGVIIVGTTEVGRIAELHPMVQEEIGISERTAIVEINLSKVIDYIDNSKSSYEPVAQFPAVSRDIAFVVQKEVQHKDIAVVIKNSDELVSGLELFDVYEGEHVEPGKKSLAYHVMYTAMDRTLTAEEADSVHAKVLSELENKFQAVIR